MRARERSADLRGRTAALLLALALAAAGCATPQRGACEYYFGSCQRGADPPCETPTWQGGEALAPERLVARVSPADATDWFVTSVMVTDSVRERAARADAFYWYDGSLDASGMTIGSEILLAFRGCEVVASDHIVLTN